VGVKVPDRGWLAGDLLQDGCQPSGAPPKETARPPQHAPARQVEAELKARRLTTIIVSETACIACLTSFLKVVEAVVERCIPVPRIAAYAKRGDGASDVNGRGVSGHGLKSCANQVSAGVEHPALINEGF